MTAMVRMVTVLVLMLFQEEAVEECASDVKSEMTCKSPDEADSGDEVPFAGTDAPIHEIRCGLLTAKLHMRRFTCPGIHRKCIEFEGRMMTPREFTIKAEKDKQKDWKGSIRLGRYNLRTLMELKNLDFYNHAESCSLKCQSRNYIKNRKSGMGGDYSGINESDQKIDVSSYDDVATEPSSVVSSRKGSSALEDYVTQMKVKADLSEMGLRAEDFNVNIEDIMSSVLKNNNNNTSMLNNNNNNNAATNHNNNNAIFGASPASDSTAASRRQSSDFSNNNNTTTNLNNNIDVKDILVMTLKTTSDAQTTQNVAAALANGTIALPSSSTTPSNVPVDVLSPTKIIDANSPLNNASVTSNKININNGHKGNMKSGSSPQNVFSAGDYGNNYNSNRNNSNSKWPSIINRCIPSATMNCQQQQQPALQQTINPQSIQSQTIQQQQQQPATAVAADSTSDAALVALLQSLMDQQKLRSQPQQQQQQQQPQQQLNTQQLIQPQRLSNVNNVNGIAACLLQHQQQPQQNNVNNNNLTNVLQSLALLGNIGGVAQSNPHNNFAAGKTLFNNNNNNNNTKSTTTTTLLGNNTAASQQSIQDLLLAAGFQKSQLQQLLPQQQTRINSLFSAQPSTQTGILTAGEDMQLSANSIRHFMGSNPVSFWSRMRELGILDDLLNTLLTTVDELRQLYLTGSAATEEFAAQKLSEVANIVDLGGLFSAKIRERYVQTTLESNLIHKELQAILELQRKAEEQKRRLENAKRKTQMFDQIFTTSSNGAMATAGLPNGTGDASDSIECKRMHLQGPI